MRRIIFFFLSSFFTTCFAFEKIPTQELLLNYLENDIELQNLTLEAKSAALSLDYAKISNGFDVTISSGSVLLNLNDDGTKLSATPSVKLSLPQASDLSISAQTDLLLEGDSREVSDSSISAEIDLISTTTLARKVSLLKAERSYQESLRSLQKRAYEAEIEFYTELEDLLSSIKTLIKAEQTLYSDTIDFDSVKAQGYSESSSTYRLAQMQVLSDKHSVESYLRELIRDYVIFYKKCGYDISLEANLDYLQLIPDDFENCQAVNVQDFEKSSYSKIEEALWTNKINSMERRTNSIFTLSANSGYTFDNSSTDSDTVDAGLSAAFSGLSVNAGISLPVSSSSSPAISMGFALSPSTFKKNSIEKKQASIAEEEELLDIQNAEYEYETYLVTAEQNLESILWESQTAKENYEMYSKLADDLEAWYKMGIVTESEYLSAKTNAEMYQVEILMDMLEIIIYNDEIKSNFVTLEENEA